MKTIATINFKGGVGKTTVTWCLGDVLSSHADSRVLLFDLDAQGSLTQSIALGRRGNVAYDFREFQKNNSSIYNAIKQFAKSEKQFEFDVADNFIYSLGDDYHFVPSVDDLYWMELERFDPGKEFFIEKLLGRIANSNALPDYDYALFDCPPSFTFLSYSALTCCDLILIPTNPDFFAAKGVDILLRVLKDKIQPHPLPKIVVFSNKVKETYYHYDGKMAPTRYERPWIQDVKDVCNDAQKKQNINVNYVDTYIRSRAALSRAIENRRTPKPHVQEFLNLWNKTGGKL